MFRASFLGVVVSPCVQEQRGGVRSELCVVHLYVVVLGGRRGFDVLRLRDGVRQPRVQRLRRAQHQRARHQRRAAEQHRRQPRDIDSLETRRSVDSLCES